MRGDAAVRNGGATGSLWRSRLCVVCRRGSGRVGLLNRFFNGLWRARCESVVVLELAGVKRLVGRSVSHGDKRVSHDDLWRYGSWRRRACPMAASLCCMIFALCTAGEGSSVPLCSLLLAAAPNHTLPIAVSSLWPSRSRHLSLTAQPTYVVLSRTNLRA